MKGFKLFDSSGLKKLIPLQEDRKAQFEMRPVLNSGRIEKYLPVRSGGAAAKVLQGFKIQRIEKV